MKKRTIKNIISNFAILLAILTTSTITFGQKIEINKDNHPYIYLSTAYVSTFDNNHVTSDQFYSKSNSAFSNKTVRADIGLQLNNNLSIELGYLRMPLTLSRSLSIDGNTISNRSSSFSNISFYSLRSQHNLHLWKNRLVLKTGLGYALGISNGNEPGTQLGPSQPNTSTSSGNTITTTSTIKNLHNGMSNFLTMHLGLEFRISRKVNVFGNYSIYKGFTDLQEETLDYTINDNNGSFTTTTDGSFKGWELGLRYNFR